MEQDNIEVAEAGRCLHTKTVEEVLQVLESLEVLPVDSTSLIKVFETNGLGMRYLGKVAKETRLPHIREICEMEMISSACGKIFRK